MKHKLQILFIAWSVPYPTNVGGRQRTNLLYRALSELGELDSVSLHNPECDSADEVAIMRQEYGLIQRLQILFPWGVVHRSLNHGFNSLIGALVII